MITPNWSECPHGKVGLCVLCGNMPESCIEDLQEENSRFRAALKFYASRDNWRPFEDKCESDIYYDDEGKKAREALGEE